MKETVRRRQRGEDRRETGDDVLLAADHQAVALLEAPDAAARPRVHVVDATRLQRLGAAHVVGPPRVTAVDHDVAGGELAGQLLDRGLGRRARRHHDPHGPRRRERGHERVEGTHGSCAALLDRCARGVGTIVGHDLVVGPEQTRHHVAPHAAQTHDADLHEANPCQIAMNIAPVWQTPVIVSQRDTAFRNLRLNNRWPLLIYRGTMNWTTPRHYGIGRLARSEDRLRQHDPPIEAAAAQAGH